jgi:hypothetical protein
VVQPVRLSFYVILIACTCLQTGELEYPKEEQSFTIKERLQKFVTGHSRGKVTPAIGSPPTAASGR